MSTIVTRAGKGSPLTNTEMDNNLTNLNTDKLEAAAIGVTVQAYNAGTAIEGAWTDYSSTSTVTGFSSFTTKQIYYKKVGRTVFVAFNLQGTSDATTVSFTVPYAAATSGFQYVSAVRGQDNGVNLTSPAMARLSGTFSTISCYKDFSAAAWTNSGAKFAIGTLIYETTS